MTLLVSKARRRALLSMTPSVMRTSREGGTNQAQARVNKKKHVKAKRTERTQETQDEKRFERCCCWLDDDSDVVVAVDPCKLGGTELVAVVVVVVGCIVEAIDDRCCFCC